MLKFYSSFKTIGEDQNKRGNPSGVYNSSAGVSTGNVFWTTVTTCFTVSAGHCQGQDTWLDGSVN